MHHLAEQSVLDLVNGALAGRAAAVAHEHLDRCRECREVVAVIVRATAGDGDATVIPGSDANTTSAVTTAETLAHATQLERPRVSAPRRPERIDEYELGELLGRGGMGSVYRAHDTLLDREVAIKLIAGAGSESVRERFLLEARAVARIHHPNVVTVHRVGVAGDRPFIVYELVRGTTFDDLPRPLPWFRVLELAVGIARGLAAAHDCDVLHRDIKPSNIMRDEDGDVVLVDFGLAKLASPDGADGSTSPSAPNLTAAGIVLGTPRYMAPESWRGRGATPQTDLFSFGLVLYELLSGRLPFADTPGGDLARAVCEDDAPPLATAAPWVPAPLCQLVDRCLARDPARRPAGAESMATELEAIQRGRAFEDFERDRVRRVPDGNPYPGDRPFGFEHQGVFFGRSVEVRALVDQLRTRSLVVVVGEAGVGKTSLCLAGLLPILARGALGGPRKWVPVLVTPGRHPIAALADAIAPHVERDRAAVERRLASDPEEILDKLRAGHGPSCAAHVVFVDQLEDLVTVAEPDEARQFATVLARLAVDPVEPSDARDARVATVPDRIDLEILDALAESTRSFAHPVCGLPERARRATAGVKVVATVRAPHVFEVARLPGLQDPICSSSYLVLEPRDQAALREIVLEPARLSGRRFDDAAARALIDAASARKLSLGQLAARLAAAWPSLAEIRGPTT